MRLVISNRTPLVNQALEALNAVGVNESGQIVKVWVGDVPEGSPLTQRYIVIHGAVPLLQGLISRQQNAGVLILSAQVSIAEQLLAEHLLEPSKMALFGTHEWKAEEFHCMQHHRVQYYSMLEISREGLSAMTDAVMAYVRNWWSFSVIIDLSILDAAYVPGIAYKSVGGLTVRELLYVLQRLKLIRTLQHVDIMLIGENDKQTAAVAAKILAELI